jgi:hypothetical protein
VTICKNSVHFVAKHGTLKANIIYNEKVLDVQLALPRA